jgi:hypothetical protein
MIVDSDAWAVEVRSGGVPETGGRETVKEVALAWLGYIEGLVEIGELRPRTLEAYKIGVVLHLIPDYGHRRIRSITTDDLVAWHRKQRKLKASTWTIRALDGSKRSLRLRSTSQHDRRQPSRQAAPPRAPRRG